MLARLAPSPAMFIPSGCHGTVAANALPIRLEERQRANRTALQAARLTWIGYVVVVVVVVVVVPVVVVSHLVSVVQVVPVVV